ncbi:MAG: hypothetical protein IPM45_01310 [Acidimicrobiales bacterium]|nr:hypothetical protein [Acidimicrobiales bacterium]
MLESRMVPVVRAPDAFSAKVAAARLGAEGIVWQLRGAVDGPYPVGAVDVLVGEHDAELARALLGPVEPDEGVLAEPRRGRPLLVAVAAVALVAALAGCFARLVTLL